MNNVLSRFVFAQTSIFSCLYVASQHCKGGGANKVNQGVSLVFATIEDEKNLQRLVKWTICIID